MAVIVAVGGEEDKPEVVERTDMEGGREVCEKGEENIGRPNTAEGKFLLRLWFRFWRFGLGVVLDVVGVRGVGIRQKRIALFSVGGVRFVGRADARISGVGSASTPEACDAR